MGTSINAASKAAAPDRASGGKCSRFTGRVSFIGARCSPAKAALAYDPDHMNPHAELPAPLALLAHRRSLAAGDTVFRIHAPARHVHFLRRGRVVLQRFGPAGEEVAIHTAHAGEYFAEASLHSERYHCTAVVLADAEIESIDSAALRAQLQADAAFAMQWMAILARQLRRARARVERLSLKAAADRVRHLLLTEGQGQPPAYALPGTARELAGELGITHEALYRTLAAMQRDGSLERQARSLRLLR
jgi:CRP-like cAMP-binding protein